LNNITLHFKLSDYQEKMEHLDNQPAKGRFIIYGWGVGGKIMGVSTIFYVVKGGGGGAKHL
jgi:hypothetical protein